MTQMTVSPAPVTAKIFVIDDHPMFRNALEGWLEQDSRYRIMGGTHSAQEALSALRLEEADAIVLDISLPGTDGLELIKHLRAEHPRMKILVISMHDENVYAPRALKAGAHGYLMKSESGETFLSALAQVLQGEVWVSPEFEQRLIYHTVRPNENGRNPLERLSDRELEVLSLIGQGLSSRQIAERLHLSVKTIESHRLHLKEKLRLENARELVSFAVNWVQAEAAGTN